MASNYEVGRFLGKGSFASVHLARDIRTKRHCYAIKIVDVTECQQQHRRQQEGGGTTDDVELLNPILCKSRTSNFLLDLLQQEIDVQTSVSSHPNIVSLLESFSYTNEITGNDMMAMLLEYCPWGDLQGYFKTVRTTRKQRQQQLHHNHSYCNDNEHRVGKRQGGKRNDDETLFLSTQEIRHALSQILCGVSYLHSRGVVHRDIKAPNILLCPLIQPSTTTTNKKNKVGSGETTFTLLDCRLKIGDFGLAVQMQDDEDWYEAQHTICGTPSCLAPEVVRKFLSPTTAETMMKQSSVAKLSKLDSLLETMDDSSLFTEQQHIMSEQHVGYGQPADLWSCGCLLYTLIVGRNPFALPIHPRTTSTATTNTNASTRNHPIKGEGSAVSPFLEKRQRIQQIVERIIRGDWSVPSHVSIDDASLEMLLEQLLDATPRKRGTARSILNLHPFFQSDTATTTTTAAATAATTAAATTTSSTTASPSIARMNNWEMSGYASNACRDDYFSSKVLPRATQTNETRKFYFTNATFTSTSPVSSSWQEKENVCNGNPLMSGAEKQYLNDSPHHSSSEDDAGLGPTTNGEMIPQREKITLNASERQSILQWVNDQQPAARERPQDSSFTSMQPMSVSSENVMKIESELGINKNSTSMANKSGIDKQSQYTPFISMKSLHRLPQAKYKWVEPQRNGTPSKEHTVYFLGKEGIVIQQEGIISGLWMHVTSDGLGILWGKLQSDSMRSTQHATQRPVPLNFEPSSLYTEAFSRAPTSFSKHSLSSLLALQCREIISLYESLEHVVHRVKLQSPKITVLLFSNSGGQKSHSCDYFAKTMLMENDPIGDIQTEFDDGTIIRISSADGLIIFRGKDDRSTSLVIDPIRFFAALRADRPRSPSCRGDEVSRSLLTPSQLFVHHLCTSIESARECLLFESRHSSSYDYPVIRKVDVIGWNQDQWVVKGSSVALTT